MLRILCREIDVGPMHRFEECLAFCLALCYEFFAEVSSSTNMKAFVGVQCSTFGHGKSVTACLIRGD